MGTYPVKCVCPSCGSKREVVHNRKLPRGSVIERHCKSCAQLVKNELLRLAAAEELGELA